MVIAPVADPERLGAEPPAAPSLPRTASFGSPTARSAVDAPRIVPGCGSPLDVGRGLGPPQDRGSPRAGTRLGLIVFGARAGRARDAELWIGPPGSDTVATGRLRRAPRAVSTGRSTATARPGGDAPLGLARGRPPASSREPFHPRVDPRRAGARSDRLGRPRPALRRAATATAGNGAARTPWVRR